MKSSVFWDIVPCSPLNVNRRLKSLTLPSSGPKNKSSNKPARSSACHLLFDNFLFDLLPDPESESDMFFRNVGSPPVLPEKTKIFKSS
jgi:hypothetical protein